MATERRLLLVGAPAGALDAVRRALPTLPVTLARAATDDEALAALARPPGLWALLLWPMETGLPLEGWMDAWQLAPGRPLLLVATTAEQEAERSRWSRAGMHGWALAPDFPGLEATLTCLERGLLQQAEREDRQARLRRATETLATLARSTHFRGDDLKGALAEVARTGAAGLQVPGFSIWLLDDARPRLRLAERHETASATPPRSEDRPTEALTGWLASLQRQRVLAIRDAAADVRAREWSATRPQVTSRLDVGVRLRGELVGALSAEHQGPARDWTPEEEMLAGALGDIVSLALESAERHRVEAALHQSERRFRDLFEYSSDCIVLNRVALDGSIYCEDINPATARATGVPRETVAGRSPAEILSAQTAAKLEGRYRQCIEARAPISYEHDLQLPSGTVYFNTSIVPLLDEQGRVQRLASMARDVTHIREAENLRRRLEAQSAETQKNEALARMASHIAHDVNNLLTVIVAHASRLDDAGGKGAEVSRAILQATARGRELTQQVLSFGRRRPPERRPVDLAPIVTETLTLLAPMAIGVTLRQSVAPRGTRLQGDAGQLHQVLTNLVTNAIHSMPSGGTLTVSLEPRELDMAAARARPPLTAGRWVVLSVQDSGVGMDEATAQRIFEPFFTTRGEGKGTGLGLAVVQAVVTSHGGATFVDSAPGRGTRFDVYFPALEPEQPRPGTGQHLMLVDDHPGMARVSAKLLETLGYRTSVFDDPREALEAFRKAPRAIDAVLTDLSMPQMSGEEFTRALHGVRASLPVIASSGRALDVSGEELQRLGFAAMLVKPWRIEEAVATLERVLPPPGTEA